MDNEFVLAVMTDTKCDTTQHIFLVDLVTEKYKLISTLEYTTKKDAQERANALASLSLQEIKDEIYKLSDSIVKEGEKDGE